MILDTNADLNVYKEMWKMEKANGPGSTGSCCDQVNHSTSGLINNLPDVDFNIWTGELTNESSIETPLIIPCVVLLKKAPSKSLPLSPTARTEHSVNWVTAHTSLLISRRYNYST